MKPGVEARLVEQVYHLVPSYVDPATFTGNPVSNFFGQCYGLLVAY